MQPLGLFGLAFDTGRQTCAIWGQVAVVSLCRVLFKNFERSMEKGKKFGVLNHLVRWINSSHPFLFKTKSLANYHTTVLV